MCENIAQATPREWGAIDQRYYEAGLALIASLDKEREGLRKFLSGVEPNVDQVGINAPTFGWGECDAKGNWEYPVHPGLVQLRREAKHSAPYMELIYEVAKVYPGETRHETARRIIRQNQTEPTGGVASIRKECV